MQTTYLMAQLCVLVAFLPIVIDLVKSRRIIWDSPLYICSGMIGLFIGIRTMYIVRNNEYGLIQSLTGSSNPEYYLSRVTSFTLLCLIALLFGFYLVFKPTRRTIPITLTLSRQMGDGIARLNRFWLVVIFIFFGFMVYYAKQKLQFSGYGETTAYVYLMIQSTVGLLVLAVVYALSNTTHQSRKSLLMYLFIGIAVLIYYKLIFTTQGRFVLVAPCIAIAILIFRFDPSSIKVKFILVSLMVAAFLAFTIAGGLRKASEISEQGKELNLAQIFEYQTERLMAAEDFNGAEGMAFLVTVFNDQSGYLWGKSYAAVFWHWIPRKLWPNKPLTMGTHLKGIFLSDSNKVSDTINRNSTLGFSPTFLGQNYENFGYIGGIILAFFQGVLLAKIYNFCARRAESVDIQTLYACFFGFLPALARGGSIAIDLANAVFGFLPILILIGYGGYTRWRNPRPRFVFRPPQGSPQPQAQNRNI